MNNYFPIFGNIYELTQKRKRHNKPPSRSGDKFIAHVPSAC